MRTIWCGMTSLPPFLPSEKVVIAPENGPEIGVGVIVAVGNGVGEGCFNIDGRYTIAVELARLTVPAPAHVERIRMEARPNTARMKTVYFFSNMAR